MAAVVERAIAEDLAGGVDVTSAATVPVSHRSTLDLVARAAGVVAGAPVAAAVFDLVGAGALEVVVSAADGSRVRPGEVVVSASGSTRDLLTAERTALNLLCHLSGIATATAAWADALAGSGTRVRDTRKTTPGLRALEKYAVRCGGGLNHRMALSDAALVKDNHVVAAGGVREAFEAVRTMWPELPVEVEVDSLDQLAEVLAAGADLVLLDNFTPDQLAEAVRRTAEHAAAAAPVAGEEAQQRRTRLEASGGLTLADAAVVAATGVDFVSVGALTHSAPALDIGADLRPA
ncbi:MAG TPA: carboxylating nicotinate-nucleotide diphosphorylase [Candidatus Nanopelagicales bacterium]|nr:carboxylating nicotinate-nucleotide diphosphorylase [Candidatus Nanopelagicales bacterium]